MEKSKRDVLTSHPGDFPTKKKCLVRRICGLSPSSTAHNLLPRLRIRDARALAELSSNSRERLPGSSITRKATAVRNLLPRNRRFSSVGPTNSADEPKSERGSELRGWLMTPLSSALRVSALSPRAEVGHPVWGATGKTKTGLAACLFPVWRRKMVTC